MADGGLEDATARVVDLAGDRMTREQWIERFRLINATSLTASIPSGKFVIDSRWPIVRIGSVWHRDHEFHVYAMGQVVTHALELRGCGGAHFVVVTPLWVFVQDGSKIRSVSDQAILVLAEKNFVRFIDKLWRDRG